jgi:hypothetical protein
MDPAVRMTPLPAPPFGAGCGGTRVFFSFARRNQYTSAALLARFSLSKSHTRSTVGQSTSSLGSTQGSCSAAAHHSAQAGSAITAAI